MTSLIVINMPTRELLANETKNSFVQRFEPLNNKNDVCKQLSSLFWHLRPSVTKMTVYRFLTVFYGFAFAVCARMEKVFTEFRREHQPAQVCHKVSFV